MSLNTSNVTSRLSRFTTFPAAVLSTALALYLGYKAFQLLEARQRQKQRALEPSPTSPVLVDHFQFVKLEQFERQIEYFSHSTHILAVDMCGYGASDVPDSYKHYTTDAYVEDIVTLLQRYKSQDTVLICHSYGCGVGTHLYSRLETSEALYNSIKAMVMIAPKAMITDHELKAREQLRRTPDWAIDLARRLDRIGGIHSKSVNRLLHTSAGEDLRRKQFRWNKASRTFVLRRILLGARWPTPDDFRRIQCPLLLMAGDDDRVCPIANVEQIFRWCQDTNERIKLPFIIPKAGHQVMLEKWELVTPIISNFLIKDCGMTTMDPSWQITRKCQKENKWSLKNTEKWMNTPAISSPIGRRSGKFRAMKVLRQTDPDHSPSAFLARHPE
ncbi:hypothetical protein BX616_008286, partial [Lobosporangium transversale]